MKPLEPLTEEQITTLARDVVTNQVFITNRAEIARTSFMILALAGPEMMPPNCGAVYEYLDKAGERSVNGLPVFFSVRMIAAESMVALYDEIQRMQRALGIPIGQNEEHEHQ